MSQGVAVAVIPEEYYRKPAGVQFKKPFGKRTDAIRYAEQHGCRVVIACEAEKRYDVLCDPASTTGPKVRFELVVDRGELVAVPPHSLPQRESRELHAATETYPSETSLKAAWDFVQSWLFV